MDSGYGETHTWKEMSRSIRCELSFTLVERVKIEQHISEMIHKPNVLKFCVKGWCQSHFCGFSMPNILIQSSETSPLTAQQKHGI
jgi:hypothetical protein